jgi:hypothetical protein
MESATQRGLRVNRRPELVENVILESLPWLEVPVADQSSQLRIFIQLQELSMATTCGHSNDEHEGEGGQRRAPWVLVSLVMKRVVRGRSEASHNGLNIERLCAF